MRPDYFEMISRITCHDVMTLTAEADVPYESTILEGHFPGHPLLPGVLMIEAMAQTSGWLILKSNGMSGMPFLAGVTSAKMRQFVTPGTKLIITAEMVHEGSGYAKTKAKIRVEGKEIASSELTFKVTPFPAPELNTLISAQALRLGLNV
jgi:3-hydroxyacyl-[acyl-carrier-protein] dehydratase